MQKVRAGTTVSELKKVTERTKQDPSLLSTAILFSYSSFLSLHHHTVLFIFHSHQEPYAHLHQHDTTSQVLHENLLFSNPLTR